MLEALAGFLLVAGEVVDHAGMQLLEDRVPVRPGEPVDRRHRALAVAGAIHAPGREQRRGQIGDRPADRLRQIAARGGILLALERLHADHQPGDAIVLVGLHDAFGIFHRFVDIAVDQQRQEGAVEQFAVFRVALERRAVIGGGRGGIALLAGMAGGQIAARGGYAGKLLRGRRLRGKLDRRRLTRNAARNVTCAVPATHRARLEEITGDAPMRREAAEFARAAEVEPRMAFLRRPRKNGPGGAQARSLKTSMWQHRGRNRPPPSHIRVVRPAAAFGRNPGDVLIRVLDVAGFAVDAILRVDHELSGSPASSTHS